MNPEDRGDLLHRVLFGAAVLNGIYTDAQFAEAVGIHRNSVGRWRAGSIPEAQTIPALAQATGYDLGELTRFLHGDGTIPSPPAPAEIAARARADAVERSRLAQREAAAYEAPPAPRMKAGSAG